MADEEHEQLLLPAPTGSVEAQQQLFASMYDELRRVAQRELRRSGSSVTLSTTALLHETYINIQARKNLEFPTRAHFLSYACRAMRGLLIDFARTRHTLRRGAAFHLTSLPTDVPELAAESTDLQRLSDAIERLAAFDPRLAQVVDLRYFSGFTLPEIAELAGRSPRTVQRDWEKARLFLHQCLAGSDAEEDA